MQRLEVSGAVRPIYVSLGVKRLILSMHEWLLLPKAVSFTGAGNVSADLGFIYIGTAQAHVDTC